MIFVDTGYFLALAQPRDALHERARSWARTVSEPLIVTEYVLWETINGLSKPVDRSKAHVLLNQIRSSPSYAFIPASPELFEAGVRIHSQRMDKEWSLTDCISFVVMERHGVKSALTSDHHFEQAGYEALMRREPA